MEKKLSARICTNNFNRLVAATKDFTNPTASGRVEKMAMPTPYYVDKVDAPAVRVKVRRVSQKGKTVRVKRRRASDG